MAEVQHTSASNVPSYLDVLEISFSDFLTDQGASEKTRKNYKSDAKHFLRWALFTLQTMSGSIPSSSTQLLMQVTPDFIENYKFSLISRKTPASTINRRLSTIRNLFHFCKTQGWISENPAKIIANIMIPKNHVSETQKLLDAFERDLKAEGASKATIKNYKSDVRQFLAWFEDRQRLL